MNIFNFRRKTILIASGALLLSGVAAEVGVFLFRLIATKGQVGGGVKTGSIGKKVL